MLVVAGEERIVIAMIVLQQLVVKRIIMLERVVYVAGVTNWELEGIMAKAAIGGA